MQICSIIVGIQHYNGVEDVEKGSEVVLVFDEENRYSEDTIVVKNENGEVVGNIINKLNHPSVSEETIALNDVKNDKAIRKITTTNCKATIKRITKYVIFIVVDTEDVVEFNKKGDETMVKNELKDVNVVVELGEPQFAIGSDKIIGYDEIVVCGSCGEPIEAHHKFCSQCGAKVREEVNSSQSNNSDVVSLPTEAKQSIYTVVGIKYHSANAKVGDIVRFKVVKGTTTLFNENNESLGVLPQSDKKIKELQEIGAPIVLNQFARTDFNTMENAYAVSHIVDGKYIFLRDIQVDDLKIKEGEKMSEYQRLLADPNDEANVAYEEFISALDYEVFE